MTDATDTSVTLGHQLSLSSLASFRALSAHSANVGKIDTTDVARVAAELLTDARQVRGLHSDAIVVAPSDSAEHELHVNLHACERAALAAQRRGVEALTARLRNDDDLLEDVSNHAFADLEASARSLLAAASLSDQLRSLVAVDGPPPPPPMQDLDLDLQPIDNVVVDLTGPSADLSYRTPERGPAAVAESLPPLPGGAEGWEQRRSEILARVERVRGTATDEDHEPVEAPSSDATAETANDAALSPIIAAALSSASLLPVVDTPEEHKESERAAEPATSDSLRLVPSAPEDTGTEADEIAAESARPDLGPTPSFTDDAVVIDIVDAPSATPDDDGLADVIELQTEATVHEWPVWQGPNRDYEDNVQDLVVPADSPEAEPSGEDYPRLVSVAREPSAEPATGASNDAAFTTTGPDVKEPMFGFAPPAIPEQEASSDFLPVPAFEAGRRSQEEIAAEARQLIDEHRRAQKVASGPEFTEKEVRRRQRRLRKHQRAVEKAENKVNRDRKRVELQHERSLASEASEASQAAKVGTVAPTWFGQLAFAMAVCVLVIMVVVGVWFLLADDPGLF